MNIAVTGSIATDHLMRFDGRFRDSLVVDQLDKISLSFLVEELEVRRGGVAANICFGMGCLGLRPILVGAVGGDFVDYRSWLQRHNVDTESGPRLGPAAHRPVHLYNGLRQRADRLFLRGRDERGTRHRTHPDRAAPGRPGPRRRRRERPRRDVAHTDECRARGYHFAADPSQQLAWMDGEGIRLLIDGATYLMTNEYEAALTEQKTGWSAGEILDRVDVRGDDPRAGGGPDRPQGRGPDRRRLRRGALQGGSHRGRRRIPGRFPGRSRLGATARARRSGRCLARYVRHRDRRHQEYELGQAHFLERLAKAYGMDAAGDVEPYLRCPRP
jgi:adenosine kinase